MSKAFAEEMLRNLKLTGAVSEDNAVEKQILGQNLVHILNLSSGLPRLQTNVEKRFNLILSQPERLSVLNPFEIRCAFCKKVIHYPCWYYDIKYSVNHFHYFVCFSDSKGVNARCYRSAE